MRVLNIVLINVGPKPFTAQGRAGIRSSFLIVRCCAWGGVMVRVCLSLSYLFPMWVFSHLPNMQESVCFWISFKGSCSVYSCVQCVCVRRGVQGLVRHHLSQPPGHSLSTDCLYHWQPLIGQPLQLNLPGPKFSSCWRTGTIVSGRVCLFFLLSLYSPFVTQQPQRSFYQQKLLKNPLLNSGGPAQNEIQTST